MPHNTEQSASRANRKSELIRAAQIDLLYANASTGTAVTVVATLVLSYFQCQITQAGVVWGWTLYMLAIAAFRFFLQRRYEHSSARPLEVLRWGTAFAVGAGLAGAGWGAAGVLFYSETNLMGQVFVVFVLGGMMLGGASLLAPRPEAFLAFLIPAGIMPSLRLAVDGDKGHLAMGLLAAVFTIAIILATSRFQRNIESSLNLQFENQDLVHDLDEARHQAETLNQQLEARVEERSAALEESSSLLRSEIEQRQQVEHELVQARKLESLGVLAGGIAHDFNNFLTVIQGNVELARLQLEPDAPAQEPLEHTLAICERAAFLSSQLLTFAKGGAPVRRISSVAKIVQDAVRLARAGAPTSISVSIAKDLWPAEVDSAQIGQVLHNILLNSKQAMPEGGIIEVRAENAVVKTDKDAGSGSYVRISIQDYGCGIAEDILPRIFDPYFTTKVGWSGLGLATAYAIVSKHGGHIGVNSKEGGGTTFVVDLPASPESRSQAVLTARAGEARVAQPRAGAGRLLVMDDEEQLRILLERVLTTLGYEVETAADGAEAVSLYEAAKAAGRSFDAVLLDVTVAGGMGGIEAAEQIKQCDPSARLIVSSGYSDSPVMSQYQHYGFDAVLPKPWKAVELREVFRRVLV
ncbi:MAG: response regulator [Bryobacterales bacterium]|nr:response regulator [Bryobacterales bacterium]